MASDLGAWIALAVLSLVVIGSGAFAIRETNRNHHRQGGHDNDQQHAP